MMPQQKDIEVPLLRALVSLGGKAKARDVYNEVEKFFPQLTEADRAETLPSGATRWKNRIQWARQDLLERKELAAGGFGIWAITEKGRKRLEAEASLLSEDNAESASESTEERASAIVERTESSLSVNLEELAETTLTRLSGKCSKS
jgi:restriction endonuclease Mrr